MIRAVRVAIYTLVAVLVLAAMTVQTGCSTIERIGDNPVVVRIAVSQAVLRYIDAGDTPEAVQDRRADVLSVMTQTLDFIDSGAQAPVDSVLQVFVSLVDWDRLSLADQYLAHETLVLVQEALHRRIERGELEADSLLVLRSVVQTAIDAARYAQ